MTKDIKFLTKPCSSLENKELEDSSSLFSEHYGTYSKQSKMRPGEKIKLGSTYYKRLCENKNCFVSMAYSGDLLVGQAYYLLLDSEQDVISWVIQLVVHSDFRRRRIADRLLYSVWGFSNYRAWGLATANPLTVKTLESATFRKVDPTIIKKHSEVTRVISDSVAYIDSSKITVNESTSIVDTDFCSDHSDVNSFINSAYGEQWKMGECPECHEWFALIFREQEFDNVSEEKFEKIIAHSEQTLKEVYSRMDIPKHPWAKHATPEIETILKQIDISESASIADFGCGTGRHIEALNTKGYNDLMGVDFSERNINVCRENLGYSRCKLGDCRTINLNNKFDLILCLYDVIGSFPKEKDNRGIIKNLVKHIKSKGTIVISVMNMELTEHLATNTVNSIYKDPKSLLYLKSSNIMQSTGDIFDPNYYLIDTKSQIVYRKECFSGDGHLSAEHIIRDRRYKKKDIIDLLESEGLTVTESRYVQAGKWDIPLEATNIKAKEILLFASLTSTP